MSQSKPDLVFLVGQNKHVFATSPDKLLSLLKDADFDQLQPLPPPETSAFGRFVGSLFF